jgi:hypothetical protein
MMILKGGDENRKVRCFKESSGLPLAERGLPALWKSRSDTLAPQCRAQRARRLPKA